MMATLAVIESAAGNVPAEMAVIAAMLCEPRVIDSVADFLKPDQFSDKFLGSVYGTIAREAALGRALNPVTLRPFLENEQGYTDLGGWQWLAGLGSASVTIPAAVSNARQIIQLAQRRQLQEGLREALRAAADLEQPIEELIEAVDETLSLARDGGESRGEHSGADCLKTVIDGFDTPVNGVTCGNILSIDTLLGPMRPAHLVIGAGRPGMGKTATAISYALGAASKGHGVLFVSLEMGGDELGERMAADLCLDHRIPHDKIRDRTLNADQKREVCRAHARLSEMPLQVIDRAGVTPNQLRTMVRRWARRFAARGHKLELVIVDYLQLMRGTGKDRYEQITNISQGLKETAKENGVAVFALAQLSREVEKRADKRPQLADLRDSGQIEQDADAVLFFLREEYYLRGNEPPEGHENREKWEKLMAAAQGRIEFICAKRRHGVTGSLKGEFLYHYQAVRG